jgi:hypothetical protein
MNYGIQFNCGESSLGYQRQNKTKFVMDQMTADSQRRDQNYQNPLNLLHDNAFVTSVLILFFVAFLEILIGFFYSTYCSYPSMMHSDSSRRRVQYCAMAGGLGQYEQTIYDNTIKSQDEDGKVAKKSDAITEEVIVEELSPPSPNPTRRNSVDIQSALSSILSDIEDENDGVSITSNDDSLFAEGGIIGSDSQNSFIFDKKDKSGKGTKAIQHSRVLTQGSANAGSRGQSKKLDVDKSKYSMV